MSRSVSKTQKSSIESDGCIGFEELMRTKESSPNIISMKNFLAIFKEACKPYKPKKPEQNPDHSTSNIGLNESHFSNKSAKSVKPKMP
jgi:hypothetical protein